MKLTTFIILISLMQVSASTFGQKMTLVERSVSIEKVLMEIRKQTGYDVLIIDTKFDLKKRIRADFNAVPLEQVMDRVVSGTDFIYKIDEKNVVLKQRERSFIDRVIDRFAAIDVRGRVEDENGNPLPGASVKVKEANKVTKTNTKGEFILQGVDEGAVLQISYVGYKTQELGALLNLGVIKMELGDSELDEVTINKGYYSETKRLSTGSVVKITAKEIENQPVTSPLMALQGRVPGLEITPQSGVPGSAPTVQIRGQNSLRFFPKASSEGSLPLYIIDGVPLDANAIPTSSTSIVRRGFDPLSTINPSNIESIEVLKDADATSIYGSRGANGVILITTKNNKAGDKVNLNASVYRGMGEIVNRVDLLNTEQYLAMSREAIKNGGPAVESVFNDPVNGPNAFPNLLLWDTERYTNWQDELLGDKSNVTDVILNLSGGNGNTSFTIGSSYHKETLLYTGDFGYQRYNGTAGFTHNSKDQKLSIAFTGTYGVEQSKLFNSVDLELNVLTLAPNAPSLYDADGNLNWQVRPPGVLLAGRSSWVNPMTYFRRTHDYQTNNLVANTVIGYEIVNGLSIKASLGYSRLDNSENILFPISAQDPYGFGTRTGSNTLSANLRGSWIAEPNVTYTRQFGNHEINTVLGTTWQQGMAEYRSSAGTGFTSDALLNNLAAALLVKDFGNNNEYRYTAAFGRIGYNFKQKYVFNLTGRRDGSSRFGPGNRFGNFGAIGAAWIFSQEKFISDNFSFLSLGKFRASYGSSGNDQIGDSQYLKRYKVGSNPYNGTVTLVPTGLFNPDYAWEVTKKTEAALEMGFFKDRLSIEAAWYRNRSSNQLVDYTLPATTGFPSVLSNFSALIENTGWEFVINSNMINKGNFKWTSSFNISLPKNKLVQFEGLEDSPYATRYKVGEPLSIQYGYIWKGVNPTTGLHDFVDIDGDGTITSSDQSLSKSLTIKYFGGLFNSFTYNGIGLSFLFQFSERIAKNALTSNVPGGGRNQPLMVLDRWQKEGDITDVQRFGTNREATVTTAFMRWNSSNASFGDVSFLRLKTLSLSYILPTSMMEKAKLKTAKIFLQGQNLLTFTNYDGWDPETLLNAPPLRFISVGFQLNL